VSVATAAALRTFAFGELDASVWGVAWFAGAEFVSVGAGVATATVTAALEGAGDADEWRLVGDAVDLSLAGAGEAVSITAPELGVEGYEQLCQVRGRFVLEGGERAVDCLGVRAARSGDVDPERYESVRRVSAWFHPGEGLGLLSLRPKRSAGHDSDLITAAVLDAEGGSAVVDPRLSTTYGPTGEPARAGLELWLADGEEAAEQPYPRRAAGEALGAKAASVIGELGVQADLLRWHSRGREGAGVYLLVQGR
jgi:hypothetical protein